MSIEIKRSDKYVDYDISAANNRGYITIDTSDWINKPWMFYELPALKFEIYTETDGELVKYQNFSREIRTYNPVYSPLGVLNVTIDIRNVPEEFILRITPIFDNDAVAARNILVENGIEDGDIWGSDQDVPTQLFNLDLEFIECEGEYIPPTPPVPPTHEETITGVPPITFDGSTGEPLVSWTVLGNGSQSGTPTPDNPVMPEFAGMRTANLFDSNTATLGKYINAQGIETASQIVNPAERSNHSDFFAVAPNESYTLSSVKSISVRQTVAFCWYDATKTFLSRTTEQKDTGTTAYSITGIAPNDARFAIVNYTTANNEVMLNLGSTALPFEPFGWAEKITCAGQTVPVYLGQVSTVRRIKKLMLDGTENITSTHTDVGLFNILVTDYLKTVGAITNICSHYQAEINVNGWPDVTDLTCRFYGNAGSPSKLLYIRDSSFSTVDDFKAYLASEYAAGTPVTVWYVLATPENGIVNEPLCKIGTYADELTTIQVHGLSAPLYGIRDYKDVLNLSTGVVTRKVKKLVLDGTEAWYASGSWGKDNTVVYYMPNTDGYNPSSNVAYVVCDHYLAESRNGIYDNDYECTGFTGSAALTFRVSRQYAETKENFISYLAAQYQAGTPVTIWYVLSTPETETVTVHTGMTGEIEGYLTQISTPTPTNRSVPKWNGKEETGGTYAVTVYTPPEIQTTTGKNTLTVDTILAPYNTTINGHIKYTYWGKIREDVRSGLAQTKFPVGTILYDNEDATTGRAFQVVGYDKHFDPSLTARGYTHSMTLCQLKLSGQWQYDTIEAFLYTTVEMQPGTYKFKIPNYDTTYGGNKTYYFTSTVSVPVDSQIVLKWDYQKPPASVTAYAGPNPQTNTTPLTGFNALTLTEWVEGESPEAIDLGTIKIAENNPDSAYGKLNHIHRARYGSNNYYQSGLRQLLNTDLAANNWWNPTTIFDRPYANRTTNGYLRSLNEDFINVLATPEITHITNNVFEYPSLDGRTFTLNTEYKINTDKVFLLSHTEVGLSASPNIGTVLDYYSTHNTNNDRIKYRIDNGNAYYWWFRTPYPTSAHTVRRVNPSGALHDGTANNSHGVAPACVIQ